MMSMFGLLARFRFLRGTPLDIFGMTAERRQERQDIADYQGLLEDMLARLNESNYELGLELADLPRQFARLRPRQGPEPREARPAKGRADGSILWRQRRQVCREGSLSMSVFNNEAYDHHEHIAFGEDQATGLRAIIAVHNTRLGPGVGGCRMFAYADDDEALRDVLRLSRGMTYKSALAGLPFGGGKSVIIGDPRQAKTPALLEAMGDFIESLGGRYQAAEDSGIGVEDVRIMARRTSYVSGFQDGADFGGDPSPTTAYGVYLGIRTAVHYRLGADSMRGLRVAIQGLGHVGFHLAGLLTRDGATVYGADVNPDNLQRAVEAHGITVVPPTRFFPTRPMCWRPAPWARYSPSAASMICGSALSPAPPITSSLTRPGGPPVGPRDSLLPGLPDQCRRHHRCSPPTHWQ